MFDCMVNKLSYNIREIGFYIGRHIERKMALEKYTWQRYRRKIRNRGIKDWGRIAFRLGGYGFSIAVTVVSFTHSTPPAGTRLLSYGWMGRIALMLMLAVAWCALIYAEFPSIQAAHKNPRKLFNRQSSGLKVPEIKTGTQ
jgi:hypothetical protein